MRVFYNDVHATHEPQNFLVSGAPQPNPEVAARAETLLAAATAAGHNTLRVDAAAELSDLAAIHSPEYLQFLANIFERWQRIDGASAEVIPNIHPNWRDGRYPASAVGQAGYHMADTACPISAGTWVAAKASAGLALAAARAVFDDLEAGHDAPSAYALCRPPGHHAFADMAGGFCYLNNVAIAAQWLRRRVARVAILDVDLHHGNGTQGIFYGRSDVLTVSLHADPVRFYPFFWGHADERGAGPGQGYNLNLPLARGSGDGPFRESLEIALARIRSFAPDVLLVALGLDAHEGDPLAGLAVTTDGFAQIGAAIAFEPLPTLLVQEGGYLTAALGENLTSFLKGFEDGRS